MKKPAQIFLIIFTILILANLLVLDYFWWQGRNKTFPSEGQPEATINKETSACDLSCQETITEKIQEELEKTTPQAGQSSSPTVSPPASCALPTASPQVKVVYIPLITQGFTVETTWTEITASDFYFDLADYPSAKEVRFETHLLALHGSAKVYTRLYDVTNKRGVDYSDLSTQNDTFTRLESSGLKIWRGNNKYTVQLRSENGTEVQLKEAKLKILF